jgi:hypothetical protein
MLWPREEKIFKKQLFDPEVNGQGPTKVITVCDTPPWQALNLRFAFIIY